MSPQTSFYKHCVIVSVLLIGTPLTPAWAQQSGGSDGGTNTNQMTKEPVEFEKVGNRVRINPRKFEGLYEGIQSRLAIIEQKIPGIGKDLEKGLDRLSWFITDEEFSPRRPGEEQPIYQNATHVLATAHKIQEMSHEQLKRSWMHELVRYYVQSRRPQSTRSDRLDQNAIDQLVERLTVVFYQEYDLPADRLADLLTKVVGNTLFSSPDPGAIESFRVGFLSRPGINRRIISLQLKERFLGVCRANQMDWSGLKPGATPWLSKPCSDEIGDVKGAAAAQTWVEKCLKAEKSIAILKSLDQLASTARGLEPYEGEELFRTSFENHPPLNSYASIGQFFGIEFFALFMSGAVTGKITHHHPPARDEVQNLSKNERILGAVLGCALMGTKETVEIILNASTGDSDTAIRDAVNSIGDAMKALELTRGRVPTSDSSRVSDRTTKGLSSPSQGDVGPTGPVKSDAAQ